MNPTFPPGSITGISTSLESNFASRLKITNNLETTKITVGSTVITQGTITGLTTSATSGIAATQQYALDNPPIDAQLTSPNTSIQFNDGSGGFDGSSEFTYASGTLTVPQINTTTGQIFGTTVTNIQEPTQP